MRRRQHRSRYAAVWGRDEHEFTIYAQPWGSERYLCRQYYGVTSIDAWSSRGRVQSESPSSRIAIAKRKHPRGAVDGGGEPVVLHTSGDGITISEWKR